MKQVKGLFLLSVFIFLSACGEKIDTNMSETMPDFAFTTQDEETLSLDDLEGEWWIANLMYTNCTMICPKTTVNMVDVQQTLKESDFRPQIVSFSIDPDYDKPDVLQEYAANYDADLETWDFLTGYDFETIQKLSENTFQSALEQEPEGGQMAHGYKFYLINPEGEVVKNYNGMGDEALDELVDDVKIVLNDK